MWKSPWIEYCVGSFVLVDLWPVYTSSSSSSSPSLSVVDDVPSESLPDCPEVSVFASMAYRSFHLPSEDLALGFFHSLNSECPFVCWNLPQLEQPMAIRLSFPKPP